MKTVTVLASYVSGDSVYLNEEMQNANIYKQTLFSRARKKFNAIL